MGSQLCPTVLEAEVRQGSHRFFWTGDNVKIGPQLNALFLKESQSIRGIRGHYGQPFAGSQGVKLSSFAISPGAEKGKHDCLKK